MDYSLALDIAENIKAQLEPACNRVEIKGSLARKKPNVNDIDIMVELNGRRPRLEFGMKASDAPRTELDVILQGMTGEGTLRFLQGGDRLKKFMISMGTLNPIKLELYICQPPAQWGVISVIRTGSEEFSKWMVSSRNRGGALPPKYCCMDGAIRKLTKIEECLPMPEESDFFTFCEMEWISPESRQPHWGKFDKKAKR